MCHLSRSNVLPHGGTSAGMAGGSLADEDYSVGAAALDEHAFLYDDSRTYGQTRGPGRQHVKTHKARTTPPTVKKIAENC